MVLDGLAGGALVGIATETFATKEDVMKAVFKFALLPFALLWWHPQALSAQSGTCGECMLATGECEYPGTWEICHQGGDDEDPWCTHSGLGSHMCIKWSGVLELAPDGRIQLPLTGQFASNQADLLDCSGKIARRHNSAAAAAEIRRRTNVLVL